MLGNENTRSAESLINRCVSSCLIWNAAKTQTHCVKCSVEDQPEKQLQRHSAHRMKMEPVTSFGLQLRAARDRVIGRVSCTPIQLALHENKTRFVLLRGRGRSVDTVSHVTEWDSAAVAFSCGDGGVRPERLCTGKHQPTLTPLSTRLERVWWRFMRRKRRWDGHLQTHLKAQNRTQPSLAQRNLRPTT